MTFTSFAQNYEDLRLWRALGHIDCGFYLDIGAQDPVMDSVSKAFYDAGWRGAHVEATPVYAAALRESRPDELVFEVAIGDQSGPMTFYEFPDTGMSTGVAEIARMHSENGLDVRMRSVPVVPLSGILGELGEKTIHWMKIDVEGMERDVLNSWGRSPVRPWVLVIESVHPATRNPSEGAWLDLILARGYKEAGFDGLSRYFVADEHAHLAPVLAVPPNIFDDFVVSRYQFSAQGVVQDDLATVESAKNALARALAELNAEQGRVAELQESVAALIIERDDAHAVMSESIRAELEARIAEAEGKVREFEAELANAHGTNQELATTVSQHEQAAGVSESIRAELEARIAEAEGKVREFEAELANAHGANQELATTVSQHEQAAGVSESIRAELEARIAEAEGKVREFEAELANAHGTNQQLATTVAQHEQAAGRSEALRRTLLSDYAEVKRSRDTLQRRLDEKICNPPAPDEAAAALDARVAALEAKNRDAENELSDLRRSSLTPSDGAVEASDQEVVGVVKAAGNEMLSSFLGTEYSPMTLNDLLELHDEEFVRRVYCLLLDREADPSGLRHYARQLRRGRSRIRILIDVSRSAEGRKVNANPPGLRRAIRRQRMRDLIVLRPLRVRLFGEDRESDVLARLRAIENQVAVLGQAGPFGAQTQAAVSNVDLDVTSLGEVGVIDQVAPALLPSHSAALPVVVMAADGTFSLDQWRDVTDGLFGRHWPNHHARLEETRFESNRSLLIVVVGGKGTSVPAGVVANFRALRDAASFDVEFGTLGPKLPLGAQDFSSLEDVGVAVTPDSLVMFIGPTDMIDRRLAAALVLERAWEREFILSDQSYSAAGRVGLVPFHGIDHCHLDYVDYFWSRFIVSAQALRTATADGAKTPAEVARSAVGRRDSLSSRLLHLQFPFIENGELNPDVVRQSRHAVRQELTSKAVVPKSDWDASVSVIVNTKDGGYLLDSLIQQLLAMPRIREVMVVSNNTSGEYTLDLLDRLANAERCTVFKYDQPFNFSAQNNLAAREASGRFLLILNDDISLIGSDWLDSLLENVDVDQPRITGPLMLYPNQSIQHGGMYLGFNNTAGHAFRHQSHPHDAPMYELVAPRLVSCLTGACLLMKRSLYDNLNGFDELLATGLQDVDLSLRATHSGAELMFDPRSIIFHHESVSIVPTLSDGRVQRRREREYAHFATRWDAELRPDRWHNRNFDVGDESLRSIRIAD